MAKTKTSAVAENKNSNPAPKKNEQVFVFNKQNYILTLISVGIITLGFVLMAGSEDIFGFTKLTLAPIIVLAGFAFGIYAIMKRPVE